MTRSITPIRYCAAESCDALGMYRCAYIDRNDQQCPTSWCANHIIVSNGTPYCRRCAGIVSRVEHLPDDLRPALSTRAPSLVAWVASDLDDTVRSMLEASALEIDGATVRQEPMQVEDLVWSFGWELLVGTVVEHSVFIEVSEKKDSHFGIVVDGLNVIVAVPPWIERREASKFVSEFQEQLERRSFYARIVGFISQGLSPLRLGSASGA